MENMEFYFDDKLELEEEMNAIYRIFMKEFDTLSIKELKAYAIRYDNLYDRLYASDPDYTEEMFLGDKSRIQEKILDIT